MFDRTDLDGLIAYEDIQSIGYPVEAEDALAAWEHGDTYEPPWYMDLPERIRHEIDSVNWKTQHWSKPVARFGSAQLPMSRRLQ